MNRKTIFKLKVMLSITFFAILITSTNAQERTCGMVELMQERMKNPEYAKQYYKTQAKFKAQLAKNLDSNSSRRMNPIIIPVAVHFPSGLESDRACLEGLAQNQIDILNEDYTGTNTDISGWTAAAPFYPNTNTGAANVLFCIATMNHPTGVDAEMVEGGPAVSIGYNFGNGNATDAAWGGYMNFVIKDLGTGLLGFSPLGGSITNGDSVVMNLGAFGSGAGCSGSGIVPAAPFNLGRTVTHELGHFYNLDHVFGSCASDDGVTDTPNQDQANGGCPTLGAEAACNATEQELFQNYMDYTDDACMFMFSAGQMTVAEAFIMTLQSQFKPNVVVCSAAPSFLLTATNTNESICIPANDVIYNLSYTATGNNSDPTTFSASNLPAGATATYNPTTLNNTGSVTMTISNLSSATAGNYIITTTGTGIETKTLDVNLGINSAPPSTPSLTTPSNGQTDASLQVDLTWDVIADAITYTVETATDNVFTTNVTSNAVTDPTYTTIPLAPSTQYFWRVKSANSCGESSYSSVYNFTTANVTCNTVNSTQNNITIPATGTTAHAITSTINMATSMIITDINVTVNVQHVWAGDLELALTSPNGTSVVMLINSKCDDGTDDIGVTYDDQASGPVVCSTTAPSVGGVIQPENPLSVFNGESTLGDWILTTTDGYPSADGGTFLNYSIEVCGTSSLSVDEFSLANSLSLWPNPSQGEINVSFNTKNNDAVNINLYDLRGRLINKQSFENTSNVFNKAIQLGDLESSIYILSIENAGQTINKRIVIE